MDAKGKAKEAYGAITGDEERRAEAEEQATQRARIRRAQEEARQAGAQGQGAPGRRHGHLVWAIDALSRRQS